MDFSSKQFNIVKLKEDIKKITKGNKAKFARGAKIKPTTLYSWLNEISQPSGSNLTKLAGYTGRAESEYYTKLVPYEQLPELMGIPKDQVGRDSNWAEAGKSDIDYLKVTGETAPPDKKYMEMVKRILNSEHTSVSAALRANIDQFDLMIDEREKHDQDEKRMKLMEDEIKSLKREVKRATNFECGSADNADNAGQKG